MTWAAPWALVGLAVLPLIWWLHRRLKRPPRLDLPSLMFMLDEDEAHALPRGRRLDAELVLALAAAACLVLAAAGPLLARSPALRLVRVVLAGGAPARARGYDARVRTVLETIRGLTSPHDELVVVREPPGSAAAGTTPRPTTEALLAAAHAGPASLRVVVSDLEPPQDAGGVAWVAVGDPLASNVGVVAVRVLAAPRGSSLFVNVLGDGPDASAAVLTVHGAVPPVRRTIDLASGGLGSLSVPLAEGADRVVVTVEAVGAAGGGDALDSDDRVVLVRRPLAVHVSADLPAALRDRARFALDAALGAGGTAWVDRGAGGRVDLEIRPRGDDRAPDGAWVLVLEPVAEGDAVLRAPAGGDETGREALVRDLSTAGCGWVYRAGAQVPLPGEEILLARRLREPWPVVLRAGRRVRLAADPLRGEPPPADTAFWPLLLDNLARLAAGHPGVGGGFRATGLLHAPSSRLGRARASFDAQRLATAPPHVAARPRPLRPLLTAAALALLGLLWSAPWLRRRLEAPPSRVARATSAGP